MSQETKAIYLEKLSRWNLSQDKWDTALDNLIAENTEGFPTLGQIYPYLKGISQKDAPILHWLTFDLDGSHYAMKCKDLAHPPAVPCGAVNIQVHPDLRTIRDYKPATIDEARAAFRQGFVESGGDPAKLEGYFKAMFAKPKQEVAITDDDIPF